MAHDHTIYDVDKSFVIDPETRVVTLPKNHNPVLIQYDHNSEYITFETKRYVEGHDLLNCNVVEIHFNNIASNNRSISRSVYLVEDLKVDPSDNNKLIFTWAISRNATCNAGIISFVISFSCVDDMMVEYRWNTVPNNDLIVVPGIYNGEAVAQSYADVLETWRQKLFGVSETEEAEIIAIGQTVKDSIRAKADEALASIPEDYTAIQVDYNSIDERIISSNEGHEFLKGNFIHGSLNEGVLDSSYIQRIVSEEPISYDRDITIHISDGYRVSAHYFVDGVFVSDSGWKTGDYTISAGEYFKIIVAKVTEEWVEAEIPKYLAKVPIDSPIGLISSENSDDISLLYSEIEKSNIGFESIKGNFAIGGLLNGEPVTNQIYRIAMTEPVSYDRDIEISVNEGYSFTVHLYKNGEFEIATDWLQAGTKYLIKAGKQFKVAMSNNPVEWVQADIATYLRNLNVTTSIYSDLNKVKQTEVCKRLFSPKIPRFLAHRGLMGSVPENTISAFKAAGKAGAYGIETDIYITSDGYYMCSHDDDISAYTDAPEGTTITGNTKETIQSYTVNTGSNISDYPNEKIPTLEEYLEICLVYGCVPFIEIKNINDTFSELVNIVNSYGFYDNAAYINYKVYYNAIRKAVGDSIICINLEGDSTTYESQIDALHDAGAYNVLVAMSVASGDITNEMVKKCHEYGYLTNVWTVDDSTVAEQYIKMGVDLIVSNTITKLL